ARGLAVDRSGNVYVTGQSNATWGSPVRAYTAGRDAFVAKLSAPIPICHKGDGDGDAEEHSSGKNEHHHFHKKSSCDDPDDNENDNVRSDDDRGSHFQSTSFTSSTYTIHAASQAITIV